MGRHRHPQYFIYSLREFVLSPISGASCLVEQERSEVHDELEAFKQFRDRIIAVDPVEQATPQYPGSRYETIKKPIKQVRSAYEDTVMNTSHYDEALIEHMVRELGANVAAAVRVDTPVELTPPYKKALVTGTTRAVSNREAFIDTLNDEAASINQAKSDLTEILATLDTTVISEWHFGSFTERIDETSQRRQKELRRKVSTPQFDEYSLCRYLYQEESWTFPVLTAIARLRESVDIKRHTSDNN